MRKLLIFITLCLFMVHLSYAQHPMHKITGTEQDTIWVKDGATIDSGLVVNGNIECDTITAYVPITSVAWDTLAGYPDTTITNGILDSLASYSDSTISNAILDSLGAYPDTVVTNRLSDTLKAYLDSTNLSSPTFTGLSTVDSLTINGITYATGGLAVADTSSFTTITASEAIDLSKNANLTIAGGGSGLITAGGGGLAIGASILSFISGADSSYIYDSTSTGLKLRSDENIYINDVFFNTAGDINMPAGSGISLNGSDKILDMKSFGSALGIVKYGVLVNDTTYTAPKPIFFGALLDSITSGAGDSLYIGWKFSKPDTIFDVR